MYKADLNGRFEHLVVALMDIQNTNAALHLYWLQDMDLTLEERAVKIDLLEKMAEKHPDFAVRALAAHMLAGEYHKEGDGSKYRKAYEKANSGLLPMVLVGPFDNETASFAP